MLRIWIERMACIASITLLLFAIELFSFHGTPIASDNDELEGAVRQVVEEFCNSEFMGVQDTRMKLVRYSDGQREKEEKMDPLFRGRAKTWEDDPLVVISSYRLSSVKIKKPYAVASVIYHRLAHRECASSGNRLVRDSDPNDIVELHLMYEDDKWWVFDPPDPRISREVIIEYYRKKIGRMETAVRSPDASEAQEQFLAELRNDLAFLENLQ